VLCCEFLVQADAAGALTKQLVKWAPGWERFGLPGDAMLLFPKASPSGSTALIGAPSVMHPVKAWVLQFMDPLQALRELQALAIMPGHGCNAAVLFRFDDLIPGDPDTLSLVDKRLDHVDAAGQKAQPQSEQQQQQQSKIPSTAKRNNSSSNGDSSKKGSSIGMGPAELSALLRYSPPAGTVDSWRCVLEAHPQGIDSETIADMLSKAGSSSSSSSSGDAPSPVQSWLLPQLLDEERPALLVCEPGAAGSSSSTGDAGTAVALVAAAEIAAIEALAAAGEAAAEGEDEYGEDDSSSSSAAGQQPLPWEVEEAEEDEEAGASQLDQLEVHSESQGQGSEVQGDEEEDEEEGQEEESEAESEADEDDAAAKEAACAPYMLWLCRTAAAAEQAAAQHSSMLAAAGVKAVALDAALVRQLVEANDKGIELQDEQEALEAAAEEVEEPLQAAESKEQEVQEQISRAERLLPLVVAAKAEYAAAQEHEAREAAAAEAAAEAAEEGESDSEDEEPWEMYLPAGPLYRAEPWHECLPKGVGCQLYFYLPSECTDAEAELRNDLERFAEKLSAATAAVAAATAAVAAAKQKQQQQGQLLEQQLDAVQLQLGEVYAALSEQLGGAHVVFAAAGELGEAVESSEGVIDLGSMRWLVADSYRGLIDPTAAAAAAAAADVDAGLDVDDEEEEQEDAEGASASDDDGDGEVENAASASDGDGDDDEGYHEQLMQLAKLLPGARESDNSSDRFEWQQQDSSQAAQLVYITQVRSADTLAFLSSCAPCDIMV
jgi:hypothetical protein